MRRIVALLVAVGLVIVAVVIRNGINSGGGSKLRLVCTPELASVCNGLGSNVDVTVEEPGTTADRLEKVGAGSLDGWLTPGPWNELVQQARIRAGNPAPLSPSFILARSPIGLAVFPERLATLATACGGQPGWKCLGDAAGKVNWSAIGGHPEWGDIKIGMPDPTQNATGLAALGAATIGYFGTADPTAIDVQNDGFRKWLRNLATATKGVPPLDQILAAGASVGDMAATIEAVGSPAVRTSARSPKPTLLYPAPVVSADVVLGSAGTDRGQELAHLVERRAPALLVAAGWKSTDRRTAPSLLPGDLLDALRAAWRDAS